MVRHCQQGSVRGFWSNVTVRRGKYEIFDGTSLSLEVGKGIWRFILVIRGQYDVSGGTSLSVEVSQWYLAVHSCQ